MNPTSIELYSPVLITNPITGIVKKDSVKVKLTTSDTTGAVTAQVDCPDAEVITNTVTTTITIPPTPLDVFKWIALGILLGFILTILLKK